MHTFKTVAAIVALTLSTGLCSAAGLTAADTTLTSGDRPLTHIDNPGGDWPRGGDRPIYTGGYDEPHNDTGEGPVTRPSTGGLFLPAFADGNRPLRERPTLLCHRDVTEHPGALGIVNVGKNDLPPGTVLHYIFQPSGIEGTVVLPYGLTSKHAWSFLNMNLPPMDGQETCSVEIVAP